MKSLYLLAFLNIIFSHSAFSKDGPSTELERLNFFPEADAFFIARYTYEHLNIETPLASVMVKEVNNYQNILALTYAQRVSRKMFVGANGFFENSSENAVKYGIPFKRRFNASGLKEPEIFVLYRLKFQEGEEGMVDSFLSFSPAFGEREIGTKDATRYNGRNILKFGISHGLHEGAWEFKSALSFDYFDEGEERTFNNRIFDLGSFFNARFLFSAQCQINSWLYSFGSLGVVYTSTEVVSERGISSREMQAGTGSLFELGLKKPLGDWSLIELGYNLKRYEYFVKATPENLEGNTLEHQASLIYKMTF